MSDLLKTSIAQAIRQNLKYRWLKIGWNTNKSCDPPSNYACSAEITDAVDAVIKVIMALDRPDKQTDNTTINTPLRFCIIDDGKHRCFGGSGGLGVTTWYCNCGAIFNNYSLLLKHIQDANEIIEKRCGKSPAEDILPDAKIVLEVDSHLKFIDGLVKERMALRIALREIKTILWTGFTVMVLGLRYRQHSESYCLRSLIRRFQLSPPKEMAMLNEIKAWKQKAAKGGTISQMATLVDEANSLFDKFMVPPTDNSELCREIDIFVKPFEDRYKGPMLPEGIALLKHCKQALSGSNAEASRCQPLTFKAGDRVLLRNQVDADGNPVPDRIITGEDKFVIYQPKPRE